MREFEAPYGVPLQPFPTGSNWSTTHDMIEMLFSDLRQPWVQNFVLRSDPKQDVAALTDPKNYLRAISLSYSGKSIPQLSGGFESSSFHVRLNIPVFTVGDIGVGLGVECSDAGGAVFSKSDQFFRSVFNNRRHSQLNVRVLDGEGKIEAGFQYYSESGFWQYCILVFDEVLFLSAFDELTFSVDFEKIQSALIRSIIGGAHRENPQIEIASHSSFPNKVCDNAGEHIWKNIFCSYVNAQPVMTFPVFSQGCVLFDYNAAGLRKMRDWGVVKQLQSVRISPAKDIRISTDAFIDLMLGDGDFNHKNNSNFNSRSIQKRTSKKTRTRPFVEAADVDIPHTAPPPDQVVDVLPFPLPLDLLLPPPTTNNVHLPISPSSFAPVVPQETIESGSIAPQIHSDSCPQPQPAQTKPTESESTAPPYSLPQPAKAVKPDSTPRAAREIQFVNIAPAPIPTSLEPNKQLPQELTEEDKAKAKAERRKLQKREAAQRFNARKAAERLRKKKEKEKT